MGATTETQTKNTMVMRTASGTFGGKEKRRIYLGSESPRETEELTSQISSSHIVVLDEDPAPEAATGDGGAGDAPGGLSPSTPIAAVAASSTTLSSRLAPSYTQAFARPIVVRPEARPPGLLGRLQTVGAVLFLWLMGSSLYLVIASALYIVIGFGVLGHRIFPSILLSVWVGQALFPVKVLHQDPLGIKRSWLFREMVTFFDLTLVMEKKLDTSKKYLFAQHPHGILPLAPVLSAYFVSDVVPGGKIFCLIHR
jgi:hypothetical protein